MGSFLKGNFFGYLCRSCCEIKTNVIYIFSEQGKQLGITEKIQSVGLPINPMDELPKLICHECIATLTKVYNFQEKVIETHRLKRTNCIQQ